MNGKIAFLVLLMIIPLLTVAVTTMPDADADKGDGKSCSKKDKSGKTMSSSASKMSYKMSKKSF